MTRTPLWCLTLLALSCAVPRHEAPPPVGIPDRDVGLGRYDILDVPEPAPVIPRGGDPGENPLLPRAHVSSPPGVPHAIDDFLPLTLEQNLCVDCHLVDEKRAGEPTPIPPSHLTDLRHAPDEVRDTVVGARWVCTSCHVTGTDAAPLVKNVFAE